MLENIYKVDGKFPDPYEIEEKLTGLKSDPDKRLEYQSALSELKESGLSSHPLLSRFSVES
jgi:hypothetical protein